MRGYRIRKLGRNDEFQKGDFLLVQNGSIGFVSEVFYGESVRSSLDLGSVPYRMEKQPDPEWISIFGERDV